MENEIWKMFELTGNVDSYLYYKSNIYNEEYKNETDNNIGPITTIE